MIALRMLAYFMGCLVLVVPPAILANPGTGDLPALQVAGGMLGMALVAASFFYVGLAAKRMRRPGPARKLGCTLLMSTILISLALLWLRQEEALLWCSAIVFAVSAVLFLAFAFPAAFDRRQRTGPYNKSRDAGKAGGMVLKLRRRA